MPWKIVKNEPRCVKRNKSKTWGVVNKENNRLMGCHASEDAAKAQLAALNTNVQESKKLAVIDWLHG